MDDEEFEAAVSPLVPTLTLSGRVEPGYQASYTQAFGVSGSRHSFVHIT